MSILEIGNGCFCWPVQNRHPIIRRTLCQVPPSNLQPVHILLRRVGNPRQGCGALRVVVPLFGGEVRRDGNRLLLRGGQGDEHGPVGVVGVCECLIRPQPVLGIPGGDLRLVGIDACRLVTESLLLHRADDIVRRPVVEPCLGGVGCFLGGVGGPGGGVGVRLGCLGCLLGCVG